MSFEGQVVIVTGAAHGIGREVALAYAGKGAKVVFADHNEEKGAAVAAAARNEGH
ncbi:SDR family NAD(P)-dependent oxidoreductase, partial [Paenibacillus sp. 28ISP30-2]|nr:SDR family NAD(P)-dependent oxidoreductase [Paenibacillus sp. 28ISP30-2]